MDSNTGLLCDLNRTKTGSGNVCTDSLCVVGTQGANVSLDGPGAEGSSFPRDSTWTTSSVRRSWDYKVDEETRH